MIKRAMILEVPRKSKTAKECSCRLQTILRKSRTRVMRPYLSSIFGEVGAFFGLIEFLQMIIMASWELAARK